MKPEPGDVWLRVTTRSACYVLAFRARKLAYGAPYGLAIARRLPKTLPELRTALERWFGARTELVG